MPHKLPPLNALRIFEVAARAGSYSAAARELHLTHGAVSRQIEILEQWLGQPLFIRQGQRMVPTVHAQAFAREISTAFDQISAASERYGRIATRKVVRVNAPATFAMRWLIPRLDDFRRAQPEVDVRVSTAFSNEAGFNGTFDVAIRRSLERGEQFESVPVFSEYQTVIASPALLRQLPLQGVEDLVEGVFLYTETRPGSWESWLQQAGHASLLPVRTLRFDHFFVTLQAVADSLGFAIGTFPTLEADRASGRIATPFGAIRAPGNTYHALVPRDADKPLHLRAFLEWLQQQGAAAGEG
ncbi:LysR substrate-binding domain-containing protein [Cupriavidus taiwanensis]|uniref:Transcriptional activator LysR family n=1 Tax=Cupriavidus taiwanensis TaxID=164546 RepID=A0A375GFL8_9BURK|nr:LysR substrate-binding domain-containing protein [Cupriavidus taiwanensis]SOY72947.1 transcriptional activator; LysR family [Cupriavidus taiwanensis]SOZ10047.1 transcriptional activator; LysR family [Cupriavidus taiwanensis]SOZ12215.1 transcriptional activator; LysR family [Cupriavidus taiwanensis]SOZ43520.1 transcriptional activator; LysR family [Cupriavidus taiwanensis]SPC17474.1 Transcriptional activator LysR family [Cupriavidus taiwanensis]